MANSCCVEGCRNVNIGANSGVLFYKFPDNEELKKRWIDAVNQGDWKPDKLSVICSGHFATGQRHNQSWHPDYVPSVFRNIRRTIKKPKWRDLEDVEEPSPAPKITKSASGKSTPATSKSTPATSKSTSVTSKSTPATSKSTAAKSTLATSKSTAAKSTPNIAKVPVDKEAIITKLLNPVSSIKRLSLTTPTRNTKGRKTQTAKKTLDGGPKKINKKKVEKIKLEDIDVPVKLPESDVPKKVSITKVEGSITSGVKRKKIEPEYEVMPILKNLSIVLERTSEKKIKLSTMGNEVDIKEEPKSDNDEDYDIPEPKIIPKESPQKAKKKFLGQKVEEEEEEEEDEEEEEEEIAPEEFEDPHDPDFESAFPINECYNCESLKQKLNRLEINMKKAAGGKCKQCITLKNKLIAAEASKGETGGKCGKCSTNEAKSKRVENQLKKLQTELAEMHNKLAAIEISEQAFKKYKSKVKMYTGLPNYETLAVIFDHLKSHFPATGVKALSPFQMFVLVLMRAKLNLPFWDLTYRFGAPPNTIQQYYSKFIDIIEGQLAHVILWPKANLHYRLQVLASNLKQSYGIIKTTVDVDTLLVPSSPLMEEDDKVTRVCAALYHISQLVSSNHSQQLVKILRSKDDTDRSSISKSDSKSSKESKVEGDMEEVFDDATKAKMAEGSQSNGDVDDSDIFLEDFAKETSSNSNDSLNLECRNLKKEVESLTNKLDMQFRCYTGIRSYDVFINLLGFFENHIGHISKEKLTSFQQLHLVLMRFKLNLEAQDLSCIFGVDQDHIVYITRQWIDVITRHLSQYIDWPAGIEDEDGEKKLMGTVKIKYQILWSPRICSRNKSTGREREKIDMKKLIRACAAIYNIDDIEVFKNGQKEQKSSTKDLLSDDVTNEDLEKQCQELRTELYNLRKCTIQHYTSSVYTEESFKDDDQMVKFCTGFPTYEALSNVFSFILPASKEESRKLLTPFQQFIAVLLRLKLNLSIHDVGFRFGMGTSNVHKLFQDWLSILHIQLSPYITWPDDDDDVAVFTDVLRKTYAYLRSSIPARKKDQDRKLDNGYYDIATLVCAGLYNAGEVTYSEHSDTEFDSFDEDW